MMIDCRIGSGYIKVKPDNPFLQLFPRTGWTDVRVPSNRLVWDRRLHKPSSTVCNELNEKGPESHDSGPFAYVEDINAERLQSGSH